MELSWLERGDNRLALRGHGDTMLLPVEAYFWRLNPEEMLRPFRGWLGQRLAL